MSPSASRSPSSCPARPSRCGTRSPPVDGHQRRGSCPPTSRSARAVRSSRTWARRARPARSPGGNRPAASPYEEPDWAALAGHEGAPVTPLVTEFLVEAQSGGTCVAARRHQRVRHRCRLGAGVLRGDGEGLAPVLRAPPPLPGALPRPVRDADGDRRQRRRDAGRRSSTAMRGRPRGRDRRPADRRPRPQRRGRARARRGRARAASRTRCPACSVSSPGTTPTAGRTAAIQAHSSR